MSWGKPTTAQANPAEITIEWSGSQNQFTYYDKDSKSKVAMGPDLKFIVLDRLNSISGYSQSKNCGIWSNEIRSTETDLLKVNWKPNGKKETLIQGLYGEIKDTVKEKGGKYCQVVYALMIGENENKIVRILFKGSSLVPWIEAKVRDVPMYVLTASNGTKQVKGTNEYYSPTIAQMEQITDDNHIKEADKAMAIVETYLNNYLDGSQDDDEISVEIDETKLPEKISSPEKEEEMLVTKEMSAKVTKKFPF